jgi:hypothetical protein
MTTFLHTCYPKNRLGWLYAGGSLLLLYLWYRLVSAPTDFHFIMGANLIFHEAGHFIFMPFGGFLSVLGGTIFELGIPLLCLGAFVRQQSYAGSMFTTWWAATALYSIGTYIRDAQTQALPLLSGDPSAHDWTYLLGSTGLLAYDTTIGGFVIFLSYVTLVLSVGISFYGWQK